MLFSGFNSRCAALLAVLGLAQAAAAQGSTSASAANPATQPLLTGWQFRQVGLPAWQPATVPGCVHTDLLATKQIADPLYRDNELQQQWIGQADWEYETTFTPDPATRARSHVELVFRGLDTYADVTLNDAPVLHADNMFREWRADVRQQLRAGANHLRVHFRSPLREVAGIPARMGYTLYSGNDSQAMGVVGEQGPALSPYTRKAPYQYGWDWGPRFVTMGIWQPVQLEAWDDARVSNLQVKQQQLSTAAAQLGLVLTYEGAATAAGPATLVVETQLPGGQPGPRLEQPVRLQPGQQTVEAALRLPRPERWFPAGYGPQPLYTFTASLVQNGRRLGEARARVGLRTLQLRRQPDQYGKSFEFVVNGIPVFAKGANWIPADIFPTRVTPARYRQLLTAARNCNMNMLRVWGGGIYENDAFYDLCDELGLLVWQDFMFACTFYPGDAAFMQNVREEATQQVRRLRNHPSLALWVGNNENEVAWQDWGLTNKMGPEKQTIWSDYLRLFRDLLPGVVRAQDSARAYWSSSPSADFEDKAGSQATGDVHYWEVWGGTAPIADYEKQVPRFVSEYGFQSFPELASVQQFAAPADLDLASPVMRQHQRSAAGNPRLVDYMRRDYPEPKDFASFLYVSQVLQAQAIKRSAEHLRRNRPRVMGSLYWQLDDSWGGASWSSIDYYGRWKALQYYARRFYAPLLVSPHAEGGQLRLYVVSDQQQATPATLRLRLLGFDGRVRYQQTQAVLIEPLSSRAYLAVPRAQLLRGQDSTRVVLTCELTVAGQVAARNTYYFAPPKALPLPRARVAATWQRLTDSTYQVTLRSSVLAREVCLTHAIGTGFFEDNYFDLLPGETRRVIFHNAGPATLAEVQRQVSVCSLVDAF